MVQADRVGRTLRRLGRRFHHQMDIGAAEGQGCHPRQGKLPVAHRPSQGGGRHLQPPLRHRNFGVGLGKMQRGGNLAVMQRQHHLDQTGDPTGRSQMGQVGFNRPEPQGMIRVAALSQHRAQGGGFDRVAQLRAGAVAIDIVHLPRQPPGLGVGPAQHRLLSGPAGGGHAVGAAVLGGPVATDHRQHPVAVLLRLGQRFEHHQATAFAQHNAVAGGVKGPAAVALRQHPQLGQPNHLIRAGQHADPARQRGVTFAAPQGLHRLMHRQQRGRADRIDGKARPFQVEKIGNPVGDNPAIAAGSGVAVDPRQMHVVVPSVFAFGDAEKDAAGAALHRVATQAGVIEGLLGHLQGDALLRIHGAGFARRNTEIVRVEAVHVAQHRPRAGDHLPRRQDLWVVKKIDVPTFRRYVVNQVLAVAQHFPEAGRIGNPAGQPTTQADNGNRRVGGRFLRLQARLQNADGPDRLPQTCGGFIITHSPPSTASPRESPKIAASFRSKSVAKASSSAPAEAVPSDAAKRARRSSSSAWSGGCAPVSPDFPVSPDLSDSPVGPAPSALKICVCKCAASAAGVG